MALLQDLIRQINDPTLRDRILQETDKLMKQKKFGLVFEEHLPECTPLHDVPIRVGSKVALKTGYVSDIYMVIKLDGNEALCDRRETHEKVTFQLDEIVAIAEFGEPIYPTLKPLDAVQNAPDSDLWHKFCIVDLDYVMHGSYNWSKNANYNEETLATALDREFVSKFADEFMEIYNEIV